MAAHPPLSVASTPRELQLSFSRKRAASNRYPFTGSTYGFLLFSMRVLMGFQRIRARKCFPAAFAPVFLIKLAATGCGCLMPLLVSFGGELLVTVRALHRTQMDSIGITLSKQC